MLVGITADKLKEVIGIITPNLKIKKRNPLKRRTRMTAAWSARGVHHFIAFFSLGCFNKRGDAKMKTVKINLG